MVDAKRFERQLRERKEYLEKALNRFERALEEPASNDAEDRASEREGDEVLESLGSSGLTELRQIEAALERIDKGEYGICVNCGEPIPEKRLEIIPHAARCARCA
jgi:RNA polymerase-binding transcription factor DksA